MERFDSCFHPYHACDPHPNEYHENIHYTPDQINALLGLIPYKADRAEVPKMETLNDVNYIGHVATSEALPDKMEQPSWALVGSVKKTKPYFYYVEGFVPKGYRAGWNDLSGVLGTYDLTVDKVSIFDYNLLTEYNVSRNHTQDTRIFSHDWKEQRYFSAFPDYVEGKKYRPCDRVNMPGYTKTSFVAQRSTSKAPFVVKKSNVFTFEDAIALVPEEYRIPGMKVTFVSAYTNQAETWYFKGNSASLWKDKKSWWKIDLEAERNEIHAEEVFIEKMEAPEMVADRAIADENGNRIPDTYLTRKAVRRHIEDTFNDMFIDNPPTVMDGMITPEMLSESTKQLIGNKSITNFADDEDITSVHGQLKLANKRYDPNNYSGKGRCYLRKNLVAGRNILTQSMICWSDTIYVIQYDYDLEGKTITIPSKCTLDFQGGGFSNGTVVGDNTKIEAGLEKIFGAITINGSWDVAAACPEWFGALPDGVHDCTESIQDTINNFDIVKLNNGIYFIGNTIQVRSNITLFGEKGKTIIKSPTTKEFDVNDLPNANTLPYIFYSEKAVKVLFRGLSFILGDYYNGIGFRQSVNGDTDEWDAKIYVENCHFEHGYRAVSIERTYRECRIIDSISYYACGDYAFFMEGTDNSIHNSTVGSCQQGGIYLSQNSRMSNCKVFVANKAWRYKYDAVTPRSKYAVYVSGSYCNVTGLDIQQNCANGIYVGGHQPQLEVKEHSAVVSYTYVMPTTPMAECHISYEVFGDGRVKTTLTYDPVKELGDMPEFGVMFKFNADYDHVEWYGLGEAETYADRKHGAKFGIYKNMVADNMAHYMVPQECGAKEEVRWAKVTDRKGRGMLFEMDPENGPMMFSALPYTPHEMENAMHPYELPEVHYTVVRAAKGQMGIGGDDSWGSRTHEEYLLKADEKMTFSFVFKGL